MSHRRVQREARGGTVTKGAPPLPNPAGNVQPRRRSGEWLSWLAITGTLPMTVLIAVLAGSERPPAAGRLAPRSGLPARRRGWN